MKILLIFTAACTLSACSMLNSNSTPKDRLTAQYLFQAGIGFYESQQYPQSLEAFQQAWKLESSNSAYKMHYALALDSVGRSQDAIKTLKETCAAEVEYPECHNNLAVLLLRANQYAEALIHADKALSVATYTSPDIALRNKGLSLYFLGRYSEALNAFRDSLSQNRNNSCETRMLLSRSLLATAQFKEALQEARLSRNLCDSRPETHIWLAFCLFKSARIEEAKNVLAELRDFTRIPEVREQTKNMLSQLNQEVPLAEPAIIL